MTSRIQRLDGIWGITKDPQNQGKLKSWFTNIPKNQLHKVDVPGLIQEAFPYYDGVAWYFTSFEPTIASIPDGRYILHFQAVDYLCEVWLNGKYLGLHEDAEEPFYFDVTDVLKSDVQNHLAIRVLNPYEEPVDGIILNEIPHRNKANKNFTPGACLNIGGIIRSVTLFSVPAVRIEDIYVKPDWETGIVEFEIKVNNKYAKSMNYRIEIRVNEVEGGNHVVSTYMDIEAAPGETVHNTNIQITGHQLWSVESPFLYNAVISLCDVGKQDLVTESQKTVRFGFRDFRVKNGFFTLNGKRIFLRCAHTGNQMPVGSVMSRDPDIVMRDLMYAKSLGFNMIRFIAGIALSEQLDMCDEIGLMVYEECYAGWLLGDSPLMGERFDSSASNMLRRDRNHPCVTIWGLLNETHKGKVFEQAVAFLPKLRKIDTTRLVLLNSGRFDGKLNIGSISNPGSEKWECVWGNENETADKDAPPMDSIRPVLPYIAGMGDVHTYPSIPHTEFVKNFLRTLGRDSKPVFVSEYGIGSQNNK